jgi:hypothetical protein
MKEFTPEEFVRAWQTSKIIKEVCERTGLSKIQASNRASYYRKKGIPLKKFSRGWENLDIPALTALAESLANGEPATAAEPKRKK